MLHEIPAAFEEIVAPVGGLGVRAGDLHREVGGYPDSNHRMPLCCAFMREAMRQGDAVESSPESVQGASLLIRYCIGRG